MNPLRLCLLAMACPLFSALAAETIYTPPNPPPENPAAAASPRDDWFIMVQQKFTHYGDKRTDIVFDGDSITNRWEGAGKETWASHFAGRAADFGIEADRTENVLWRLGKGQVDGLDPKLVVLMIGTNNLGRNTVEQIAEGVKAVVAEYEKRCPRAHVVLMAIFPRGKTPADPMRVKAADVNKLLAGLDDGKRVSFVDIGPKLAEPDGTISPDMMPDYLHPTAKGYVIWADALQPFVEKYAPPAINAN